MKVVAKEAYAFFGYRESGVGGRCMLQGAWWELVLLVSGFWLKKMHGARCRLQGGRMR